MATKIPKADQDEVEIEAQRLLETIDGLDKKTKLERLQIEQCVDDCAHWIVITNTLKRDVIKNGVLANKTKGAKDNKTRTQVERETLAVWHKVQPRMYEAFKRLDSLCSRGDSEQEKDTKDPFLDFISN